MVLPGFLHMKTFWGLSCHNLATGAPPFDQKWQLYTFLLAPLKTAQRIYLQKRKFSGLCKQI